MFRNVVVGKGKQKLEVDQVSELGLKDDISFYAVKCCCMVAWNAQCAACSAAVWWHCRPSLPVLRLCAGVVQAFACSKNAHVVFDFEGTVQEPTSLTIQCKAVS